MWSNKESGHPRNAAHTHTPKVEEAQMTNQEEEAEEGTHKKPKGPGMDPTAHKELLKPKRPAENR